MFEIVDLFCFDKTSTQQRFRTETFSPLIPKLPLTSKVVSRKYKTPQVLVIDFSNKISARDVPKVKIVDLGFLHEDLKCEFRRLKVRQYCRVTHLRRALLSAAI